MNVLVRNVPRRARLALLAIYVALPPTGKAAGPDAADPVAPQVCDCEQVNVCEPACEPAWRTDVSYLYW
ncbi:MAG TPA: hypothetical protein VH120_04525, partial [Gemmataceae bacterium]|nr:hypothetical protein [Gemmataceae bacterium]